MENKKNSNAVAWCLIPCVILVLGLSMSYTSANNERKAAQAELEAVQAQANELEAQAEALQTRQDELLAEVEAVTQELENARVTDEVPTDGTSAHGELEDDTSENNGDSDAYKAGQEAGAALAEWVNDWWDNGYDGE